jgi:hypothetical protein
MVPASERAKTVHALDLSATVTDKRAHGVYIIKHRNNFIRFTYRRKRGWYSMVSIARSYGLDRRLGGPRAGLETVEKSIMTCLCLELNPDFSQSSSHHKQQYS